MARAKYIISFFLFLAAFLFIGESYNYFLENFQNSYTQIGYYLPTGENEQHMNSDILEKANDFNASVFALEKTDEGAFSRTITVYSSDGVKEILQDDWNIKSENINSFFSGTTTFCFEPFEKATEKIMQNCWYPDKSPDELYEMVYPGMVDYSGAFRNEPVSNTSKIVVGGVWLIVLLALLLLTTYDISYGRKEQSIRIILGADTKILKRKKIILDLFGFSLSAILAFIILLPFTTPEFEFFISLACFAFILLVNTLLIIWEMRIKQKTPLKKYLSNKVLGFSMGLKGLTAILTVIVYNGPQEMDHIFQINREHGKIDQRKRKESILCHEGNTHRNLRPRSFWRYSRESGSWEPLLRRTT